MIAPKCVNCGFEIPVYNKYYKHTDGTILCVSCFEALKRDGIIG